MIDYLIFAACFSVFLIIAVLYLYKSSKNFTTIPGPEPIDLLEGNLADIRASGSLFEFLLKLHKDYGNIACFWYGPTFCVSLSTPDLFKEFSSAFDKPIELFNAQVELWGENSIALNNGIVARKKLNIYAEFFKPNISNLHFTQYNKIIEKSMDSWSKWPKMQLFSLHDQIFNLCIKCFSSSFFGEDFLAATDFKDLLNHLKIIWETIEKYSFNGQCVNNLLEQKFASSREYLVKLTNKAIDAKLKNSFVEVCQSPTFTNSILNADTITFFTEAVFKMTSLCTWACYHVSRNKIFQDDLRKEIKMVSLKPETNHDLKVYSQLRCLKKILFETMRLVPIVSYTSRSQSFESILNGHRVPAGTPVIHAIGVNFQNSESFANPLKFNPDRPELKLNSDQDYIYTPYGFSGKRECPAKESSTTFAMMILSNIFLRFNLEHFGDEVNPQFGFYPRPSDEILIKLETL